MDKTEEIDMMSTEDYLSNHYIRTYFQDAIERMLECKAENIQLDPLIFLHDYFKSVYDGTNTIYREYSYIYATPRNRTSFIKNFWLTFQHLGCQGDLLRINDYYALLCLLCRDFDYSILQKTVNVVLMEDASDCVIAFSDFIYAFQLQLYYDEFCDTCLKLFGKVQASTSIDVPINENTSSDENNAHIGIIPSKSDHIKSTQFLRCLKEEFCVQRPEYPIPSDDVLWDILHSSSQITFYGFMTSLGKNKNVIKSISALSTSKH